ncbi:predicted protein [Sclerotinia sclerotiorum 1980 UF-70]|uniref:Uncharacterized protein n=1 Tax=Sclerotinia sclerotiorum (strain ATCC 18683 / 1980 / Ss-1) TaxID=665079 RepID=A7EAL1_SCLS1|nr:predicted protein [Sclerotinia sclerotiorum 1980 UF-70]EDN99489.1 predicted protein [Sclerotinia sclerotiorum 1980 UF-70]
MSVFGHFETMEVRDEKSRKEMTMPVTYRDASTVRANWLVRK